MATAIFYASSTGNTEISAKEIAKQLGISELIDIASKGVSSIENYDKLIIGTSTWGDGDLQDDWDDAWSDFCALDFSGKTVALFGLGDQESYADNFVDAMGTIYNQVTSKGATVIGQWPSSDYSHEESKAQIEEGYFVGLALDEDNESELTDERIKIWCEEIKEDIL